MMTRITMNQQQKMEFVMCTVMSKRKKFKANHLFN